MFRFLRYFIVPIKRTVFLACGAMIFPNTYTVCLIGNLENLPNSTFNRNTTLIWGIWGERAPFFVKSCMLLVLAKQDLWGLGAQS